MKWIAFALCAALCASLATAQQGPSVDVNPSHLGTATVTSTGDGRWDIDLEREFDPSGFVTFTVTGDSTHHLRNVKIDAAFSPNSTFVRIIGPGPDGMVKAVDWIQTVGVPGVDGVIAILDLRVAENIGDVSVPKINNMIVENNVTGNIITIESALDWRIEGDLLGDVVVAGPDSSILFGAIDFLHVDGDIGTPIQPVFVGARDGIKDLIASAIWADIDTTINNGDGEIRYIETTTGGFTGSITTRQLSNQAGPSGQNVIRIAGDFDADFIVERNVFKPIEVGGVFPAGRVLSIGRTLGTNGPLSFGEDGLKGQVIIGARDPDGDWIGDVTVDGVSLDPVPYYDNLASDIGGGAVGLAPFNFHAWDSSPPHRSTATVAPPEAVIEHYGPVFSDSAQPPMRVEWTSLPLPVDTSTAVWTDVTDDFEFDVSDNPDGLDRVVTVTPLPGESFEIHRVYRFVPETGRLRCALVDGNPDVEYDDRDDLFDVEAYRFGVLPGTSMFDLNGDDRVDQLDVAEWLLDPVDFNDDGVADGEDLLMLLEIVEGV